jgi:hypothetical protein
LGGNGVRQRSRVAAVTVFVAYFLSAAVLTRYGGRGFGVVRIIFLALLLANIRGMWLAASWQKAEAEPTPVPLKRTLWDKLSDQLPSFLWPKVKIVFYALAAIEIALLLIGLLAPRAPGVGLAN